MLLSFYFLGIHAIIEFLGFPGGSDSKESTCLMKTWIQPLGWEDPLEKGMATHLNILPWRLLMDRGAWQTI